MLRKFAPGWGLPYRICLNRLTGEPVSLEVFKLGKRLTGPKPLLENVWVGIPMGKGIGLCLAFKMLDSVMVVLSDFQQTLYIRLGAGKCPYPVLQLRIKAASTNVEEVKTNFFNGVSVSSVTKTQLMRGICKDFCEYPVSGDYLELLRKE